MLGHPHFLAFPWFNENPVAICKSTNMSALRHNSKKMFKKCFTLRKVRERMPTPHGLIICFFCAYNSRWSLHGLTYQDQGFATASSLPPFSQLNMKQPGFTMAQIQIIIIEGSLEVKLPTIWTDEKQRWEEAERREE